jgi:hypothetical protein
MIHRVQLSAHRNAIMLPAGWAGDPDGSPWLARSHGRWIAAARIDMLPQVRRPRTAPDDGDSAIPAILEILERWWIRAEAESQSFCWQSSWRSRSRSL